MFDPPVSRVLTHACRLAGVPGGGPDSDGQLLERYVVTREPAAFRALVERHGPLVYGVCRRVLRHPQDAEDAFQATFLVLARRAASVRKPDSLPSWLHGVAARVAAKARTARRRKEASPLTAEPPAAPTDALAAWQELRAVLDEELDRLPARLREPLVLCSLNDLTVDEAARRLGIPPGTVKSRLARGRERLRRRLLNRGLTLSAGSFGLALATGSATAAVPPNLLETTMTTTFAPAPGSAAAALAAEFLRTSALSRLMAAGACLAASGAIFAGAALATFAPNTPPPNADQHAADSSPRSTAPRPAVDRFGDPLPAGASARFGSLRLRHMHTSRAASLTADGTGVVTRSWDGTTRVWDLATGAERRRVSYEGPLAGTPGGRPKWVVLAPDGRTALAYGPDGVLRFTDLETGRARREVPVPEFSAPAGIVPGGFTPDGRVVAGLVDRTVRIWDVQTGEEVHRFPVPQKEADLVLSPDGKTLALVHHVGAKPDGPRAGLIELWDVAAGAHLHQLAGHADSVYQAAFSPDSRRLASAGGINDRTVRVWDVATGAELWKIVGPPGWVRPVAFSPDGAVVAAGGQDGRVRLYDATTGAERRTFAIPGQDDIRGPWVMSVTFARDGRTVVSCGTEKAIREWDVESGRELHPYRGHQDEVASVVVTPDGRRVISAGGDSLIYVWDRATGREVRRLEGHREGIVSTVLSPDGRTLVSVGRGVIAWDVETGLDVRRIGDPHRQVGGVAISPDGKVIATGSDGDHVVRLWDLATGRLVRAIELPKRANYGWAPLAFLHGGKVLASGSGERNDVSMYFWDLATGRQIRQVKAVAQEMAASPDGRLLATTGWDYAGVRIWDGQTGEEVRRIPLEAAGPVAFSPDGRMLAAGAGDGVAHVYEVATGRERLRLAGHQSGRTANGRGSFASGVASLTFTPDGRTLVTGGGDTTVLTWPVRPAAEDRGTGPAADRAAGWWDDLASQDAAVAFRAMREMWSAPTAAAGMLRDKLRPIPAPDGERVAALVRRLDSPAFAERESAQKELAGMGDGVADLLAAALDDETSAEVRSRLEALVRQARSDTAPDRLRAIRAIEWLEYAPAGESHPLLEVLAGGAPMTIAQEARIALGRLSGAQR